MTSRLVLPTGLTLLLAVSMTAFADDWPQWRGPGRDAKSAETGLLEKWPEGGPPLAWKATGLGGGYSSLSVADGKIYTIGDLDDGSYVIARKETDGSPLWNTRIGDAGGHDKYPGPRSTPTVDGSQVFALNQYGDLACFESRNGEKAWTVNLEEDFNGKMMSGWRYSESPLVDGNRVVCTPGGNDGTLLALDRNTGKQLWRTEEWTDRAAYSSVIIRTIEGVRQYIQLTGNSVAGVDPESGRILWKADREGKVAVITTPVVSGDIVFVTSAYEIGSDAFRISRDGDRWSAEQLYHNSKFRNHHGGVVLIDGHVYGSSGDTFCCLDIQTGDLDFQGRSVGKGATVYADGHLYLRSRKGPVALIKATPEELIEVSQFDQPDRSNQRAWPHPVIANGKLYLRDQDILLCYDIRKK